MTTANFYEIDIRRFLSDGTGVEMPATYGNSKQVFYTLDAMRGAAALLVVERHVSPYYGLNQSHYSYLAVDLFFLMSGFVLEHTYGARLDGNLSTPQFTWIRLVRLYPIYIAAFIMAAVTYRWDPHIISQFVQIESPAIAVLLGVLMLPFLTLPRGLYPLNEPTWTLATELFVNIIYGFVHRRLNGRMIAIICAVSGIGLAGLAVSSDRGLDYGWFPKSLPFAFMRVAFSFFLGVAIYRWFRFGDRGGRPVMSDGLALIVLGVAVGAMLIPAHILPHNIYDLLVIGIIFPIVVYFGAAFNPSSVLQRYFRAAGLVSYAVYVFHVPLSAFLLVVISKSTTLDLSMRQPIAGWTFMFLLVGFCWIVDQVYDAPVRRRLLAVSATWWRKYRQV